MAGQSIRRALGELAREDAHWILSRNIGDVESVISGNLHQQKCVGWNFDKYVLL